MLSVFLDRRDNDGESSGSQRGTEMGHSETACIWQQVCVCVSVKVSTGCIKAERRTADSLKIHTQTKAKGHEHWDGESAKPQLTQKMRWIVLNYYCSVTSEASRHDVMPHLLTNQFLHYPSISTVVLKEVAKALAERVWPSSFWCFCDHRCKSLQGHAAKCLQKKARWAKRKQSQAAFCPGTSAACKLGVFTPVGGRRERVEQGE